jgi:hypothetical protein
LDSKEITERAPRPARTSPDLREDDSLVDARKQGELEAEVLHLRLRLKESLARELRLVERTTKAEEALENALATEQELRQQVERYSSFHRALEKSRAWQLIQAVRRLFGRAW